jgi:hypothetical protein
VTVTEKLDDIARSLAEIRDGIPADTKRMVAALKSIIHDLDTRCDWRCEKCGHDPEMTQTDIYYDARRALDPEWEP